MKVEAVKTPVTMGQLGAAVLDYSASQGLDAKPYLPFVLALLALEHRHGEAVWNYNVGNITTKSDDVDWVSLPGIESLRFRAFGSLQEGIAAFGELLAKKESIVRAMIEQDDDAFVSAYEKSWLGSSLPDRASMYSLIAKFRGQSIVKASPARKDDKGDGKLLLFLLWLMGGGGL